MLTMPQKSGEPIEAVNEKAVSSFKSRSIAAGEDISSRPVRADRASPSGTLKKRRPAPPVPPTTSQDSRRAHLK